jgi:zinc/manganese transport system substrate-binding protein
MKRILAIATPAVLLITGCVATSEPTDDVLAVPSEQSSNLVVVVSNSILGSVVADILVCAEGDSSAMTVLMPLGTDPHDFQPSSAQVALMVGADLVIANGLGLEQGLEGGFDAARTDGARVLEVAEFVDPLLWRTEEVEDDHGHDDDHADEVDDHAGDDDHAESEEAHDHGEYDPHFWFDMNRMALAATVMGAELAEVTGDEIYNTCGAEVQEGIVETEKDVIEILEAIPADHRALVTDHEAFSYFAQRYDFTIVGVVIPGGSTLGAADSKALAALVSAIKDNNVPAIFGNASLNPALLEALAAEVGGDVQVVDLLVESLGGPGSHAETYLELMTTNATLIAEALTD